jgi:PTS system mannose-specific IID component
VNGPLRFPELLRVALGGLFLQASYNPERRQGLGVAAALSGLADRWAEGPPRREFLKRHCENFNTNPAMAGPLLGASARLEAEGAWGDRGSVERVSVLKQRLEAPFAAAGDALVWNGVRPAAGAIGMAVGVVAAAWGPLLFLLLYNAVHLGLRVGGVFWGHEMGAEVHRLLRSPRLAWGLRAAPWGGAIGGLLVAGALGSLETPSAGVLLVSAGALILGALLAHNRLGRGYGLPLGVMILGSILAYTLGGVVP